MLGRHLPEARDALSQQLLGALPETALDPGACLPRPHRLVDHGIERPTASEDHQPALVALDDGQEQLRVVAGGIVGGERRRLEDEPGRVLARHGVERGPGARRGVAGLEMRVQVHERDE